MGRLLLFKAGLFINLNKSEICEKNNKILSLISQAEENFFENEAGLFEIFFFKTYLKFISQPENEKNKEELEKLKESAKKLNSNFLLARVLFTFSQAIIAKKSKNI